MVLCSAIASLEVSELSHAREECVAIGTAVVKGEDLLTTGRIYIFRVASVVPNPERPETGRALKLMAKEEVRGAVTSVTGVGTQGFLLMAQGQKCMVRGLKEDGTFLPVAFMDLSCYASVIKELKEPGRDEGLGLCLIGDAWKGVQLVGYIVCPLQCLHFEKYHPPVPFNPSHSYFSTLISHHYPLTLPTY